MAQAVCNLLPTSCFQPVRSPEWACWPLAPPALCVCVCSRVYTWKPEMRWIPPSHILPPVFWDRVPHGTGSSQLSLDWLSSEPQEACVYLSGARIAGMHCHNRLSHGSWGLEHRSCVRVRALCFLSLLWVLDSPAGIFALYAPQGTPLSKCTPESWLSITPLLSSLVSGFPLGLAISGATGRVWAKRTAFLSPVYFPHPYLWLKITKKNALIIENRTLSDLSNK